MRKAQPTRGPKRKLASPARKAAPLPRVNVLASEIPAHVVAYAAGVRSATRAGWGAIVDTLSVLKLGDWDPVALEDAVLDWLYEHTDGPQFTSVLCGTA